MEYGRRNVDNIQLFKDKELLDLLVKKEFYHLHPNILIKRLSLYLASYIIENMNCLLELDTVKTLEILNITISFYLEEEDDFCCEYLSVLLNKCLEDPQVVVRVLREEAFIVKYFSNINSTSNPDILLHSVEMMYKILNVQNEEDQRNFITLSSFPLNRLLCELNCEYFEIRRAILRILNCLVKLTFSENPLNEISMTEILLDQLVKIFCESSLLEELNLLVEVLAAALEQEFMVSQFFELNLFDKYLLRINDGTLDSDLICKSLWVFTECAKCVKFLPRLVSNDITDKFLECLLNNENENFIAVHILMGLNRFMKSPEASKRIIECYDRDLLKKILKLLPDKEVNIKTREQSAILFENLLSCAFHRTATEILSLKLTDIISEIFSQEPNDRSVDLLLEIVNIIEMLAANTDYRLKICENKEMLRNLGILLMNSFSTAILVTALFRCLCSIVDEESVHEEILNCYLCSSIKRALQSISHQVKTVATNFIMQTTRFPKFVTLYIDSDVLEVLLLNQKHAFCIPTWSPAIDSILSKCPTLKFCIRNSLGFTDITVGNDFKVSKRKFNDFRTFQCILKEEVSPLHPVIVVNFNRPDTPTELVVKVPVRCSQENETKVVAEDKGEWCYCRSPGDEFLPKYLEEVNNMLELQGLAQNPLKIKRNIDFENLAQRAKVIAHVVAKALGNDLKILDLNTTEKCSQQTVDCHLKDLCKILHCSFIPLGLIRSGCKFERAILFKTLADQMGLPCTLQRSVDGRILFNELPLPVELDQDEHCDKKTMTFMPWRMLRPTHIVDLMYNIGELYPLQSRQSLQYLRLF
ncbi:uncharacterized protein ACRADG_009978 [Cochliomyia hominivorax]